MSKVIFQKRQGSYRLYGRLCSYGNATLKTTWCSYTACEWRGCSTVLRKYSNGKLKPHPFIKQYKCTLVKPCSAYRCALEILHLFSTTVHPYNTTIGIKTTNVYPTKYISQNSFRGSSSLEVRLLNILHHFWQQMNLIVRNICCFLGLLYYNNINITKLL